MGCPQTRQRPKTSRRLLGALAAVVLAVLAIGGFLIVDWGAMLSGDSTRVQHEFETGSGAWSIIALVLAYAAYRVAKRSWRGQGPWLTTRLVLAALVSVIGLLFVAGAIKGLVDGAPSHQRVVLIAGREVPIPADTPRNVFAVTKAAMGQIGFQAVVQKLRHRASRTPVDPGGSKGTCRHSQSAKGEARAEPRLQGSAQLCAAGPGGR